MKRFNSKISRMMLLFPTIILTAVIVLMVTYKILTGIIITTAIAWYIADMYSKTFYTIEGEILKINSGMFYKLNIPISDIIKIKPSRDPSKAPALSMDRLSIRYVQDRQHKEVLISPVEAEEFMDALKEINGNIEIGELYKI